MKFKKLGLLLTAVCSISVLGLTTASADWLQYGGDTDNTRNQKDENKLSPRNVGDLQVKWEVTTEGDVTSTPTAEGNSVYFGDWAGYLYRVNAKTGAIIWKKLLSDYTGIPTDFTRHSLTIADDLIITGNQGGRTTQGGAKLVALDKNSGDLVWVTQLGDRGDNVVTASPTVAGGVAYVGVASFEEFFTAILNFGPYEECCSARGSVAAVNVGTGEILWETKLAPLGFSGNSVWGSAPAVDQGRQQVYVATGNNFSAPESYHQCIAAAGDDLAAAEACNPADNYINSVLALDLKTGAVNWGKRVVPYDTWNVACAPYILGGAPVFTEKCNFDNEYTPGPDFDFGQAPLIFSSKGRDLVGAGQKSGVYWALDPDTGDVVWSTQTGPGGLIGGHQWGSAADDERIYTSNANSLGQLWGPLNTTAGIFSALDGKTGEILWQTASPAGALAGAPATVANGVMYVCSLDPSGYMYALDAATGALLWSFQSGGSCGGGASINKGTVYWGSGYSGLGTGNNKLFAFGL